MRKRVKIISCISAVVICGTAMFVAHEPEFPSYSDPVMEITIQEDEVPLASVPKVTTQTSKKKTTNKVKLKTASKKTYTKKLPKTTSQNTKTVGKTTTETKVVTTTTEKYKKKKTYKTVTKVVTTTVKTTTYAEAAAQVASEEAKVEKYETDVTVIASKMDSRVISAFQTLGFKVYINPAETSYSGYFSAKDQSITLKEANSTIYHELGHFLAFVANNYDRGSSFSSVYSKEKGLYTGVNKAYATQSASEYFAESVRDYITSPMELKTARPQTYSAIETALSMVTDTQVARMKRIYGAYWN